MKQVQTFGNTNGYIIQPIYITVAPYTCRSIFRFSFYVCCSLCVSCFYLFLVGKRVSVYSHFPFRVDIDVRACILPARMTREKTHVQWLYNANVQTIDSEIENNIEPVLYVNSIGQHYIVDFNTHERASKNTISQKWKQPHYVDRWLQIAEFIFTCGACSFFNLTLRFHIDILHINEAEQHQRMTAATTKTYTYQKKRTKSNNKILPIFFFGEYFSLNLSCFVVYVDVKKLVYLALMDFVLKEGA